MRYKKWLIGCLTVLILLAFGCSVQKNESSFLSQSNKLLSGLSDGHSLVTFEDAKNEIAFVYEEYQDGVLVIQEDLGTIQKKKEVENNEALASATMIVDKELGYAYTSFFTLDGETSQKKRIRRMVPALSDVAFRGTIKAFKNDIQPGEAIIFAAVFNDMPSIGAVSDDLQDLGQYKNIHLIRMTISE